MTRLPTVTGPAGADGWVAARLAEGADYIKIVYDEREGAPLDRTTLTSLVRVAHDRGILAVAHTLAEAPAREAIAAGMDGLVHLFVGEADEVGADFGAFAADHGVFVVPTLTVLRGVCGYRAPAPVPPPAPSGSLASACRPGTRRVAGRAG